MEVKSGGLSRRDETNGCPTKKERKPEHKEKGMVENGMRDRGQGEGGRPMRSARRNGAVEAVVGEGGKKPNVKKGSCEVQRSSRGRRQEGALYPGGFLSPGGKPKADHLLFESIGLRSFRTFSANGEDGRIEGKLLANAQQTFGL